ncbi:cupin domain-containing protein [Paraliomyxa miuraensis]|uniref:cupin domain-containing protein n=1 Tax=Paraliomyxa miuraensis TaxID=376150 RepID=UPI0022571D31|nr:cupin domain-containing protein [Paraliomyxa miuraensis]MCX4239728.1 cupin domain-containing protein [Paraliomyxa miuraensis]
MAIHHARPAEIIDIRPLGPQFPITGTTTLFKTQAVEAIRMVLPAGKEVPSHDLPREVILQCLEGCVEILVDDQRCTLEPGHMLYVTGDQRHGLHAKEDSSVLVTILLEQ